MEGIVEVAPQYPMAWLGCRTLTDPKPAETPEMPDESSD